MTISHRTWTTKDGSGRKSYTYAFTFLAMIEPMWCSPLPCEGEDPNADKSSGPDFPLRTRDLDQTGVSANHLPVLFQVREPEGHDLPILPQQA